MKQSNWKRFSISLPSAFIMLLFFCHCHDVFAEDRYALLIGNSLYPRSPLKNPEKDVRDLAEKLGRLGFKSRVLLNADYKSMVKEVRRFNDNRYRGSVRLFYYAGHGIQHNGTNYLIPTDKFDDINNLTDLEFGAMKLDEVVDNYLSTSGTNLIFLDACRNNPFDFDRHRSKDRGLTRMDTPVDSLILAYSTAPGKVAKDGDNRNSPYTEMLLQHISTPELPITSLLTKIRKRVKEKTKGTQTPWYESSMDEDFYFKPKRSSSFKYHKPTIIGDKVKDDDKPIFVPGF